MNMMLKHDSWGNRFSRQEGFLPQRLHSELPKASVFIPGLGAIGSAVVHALARTGIGRFVIIDPDIIGLENIAGQALATTQTIGTSKVDAAAALIRSINPYATIETHEVIIDAHRLEAITSSVDVVILGMDTLSGGIATYRAARKTRTPVVDFLYFPTPNVVSTFPDEEMPEERFEYPTQGLLPGDCDSFDIASECLLRVLAYGFAANQGLLEIQEIRGNPFLRRFLRLEGAVPSFSPLTMEVGVMMAREAVSVIAYGKGIEYPRLGWPAFYIDTFRGRSCRPVSPRLFDLPHASEVIDALKGIRDAEQ